MKIVLRARTDRDLDGIFSWIEKDAPSAARNMIRRIRARIGHLVETGFPELGRPGSSLALANWSKDPYIIVYEVDGAADTIVVLAIFHGAQER